MAAVAVSALFAGPILHIEWASPEVTLLGSPSPDGRWLSFVDPMTGALSVHDLKSRTSRDVARAPLGSREFAYFSVFSRDGSRLAYAWFNQDGFYELRVADSDRKAPPQTIYRNEQAGFVQPCSWTPDNKQILTLLFRKDNTSQIALVPLEGGPPRVLRSLNWVYPKRMDISPDGRSVVYDNFAVEGKQERTLFVLSIDGSSEIRLPGLPSNALFPLWSRDGKSVYFVGDNGGLPQIWHSNLTAPAVPLSEPIDRVLLLGIGGDRLFLGRRTGSPVRSPAHSMDGTRYAYLTQSGSENFGRQAHVIVVRDTKRSDERAISPRMAHVETIQWSPDNTLLLAAGSDGKGRAGLFSVRVTDGLTQPLITSHDAPFRGYQAVWSRDGKSVYYLRGDSELVEYKLADRTEKILLKASGLRHIAASPRENTLAIGMSGVAIRITPLAEDAPARILSFPGLTDLAWGDHLIAGRGADIWRVPLDGAPPQHLVSPAGRTPGLTATAGGKIDYSVAAEQSQILSMPLP